MCSAIPLADQHLALIDPAIGASVAAIDALAREFEMFLLLFDENRAEAGLFRPELRIG